MVLQRRNKTTCESCRQMLIKGMEKPLISAQECYEYRQLVRSCQAAVQIEKPEANLDRWTYQFLRQIAEWDAEEFMRRPIPVTVVRKKPYDSWALMNGHGDPLGTWQSQSGSSNGQGLRGKRWMIKAVSLKSHAPKLVVSDGVLNTARHHHVR